MWEISVLVLKLYDSVSPLTVGLLPTQSQRVNFFPATPPDGEEAGSHA